MFQFLFMFLCGLLKISAIFLNKCCSPEQMLDGDTCTILDVDFGTVSYDESLDMFHNLSWFPEEALLYKDSHLPMESKDIEETMTWLRESAIIRSNWKPTCDTPLQSTLFEAEFPIIWFYLIPDQREDITAFVTAPSDSILAGTLDNLWPVPIADVCIDRLDAGFSILFCADNWIHKCCPVREVLNTSSHTCEPVPYTEDIPDWKPSKNSTMLNVLPNQIMKCEHQILFNTTDKWTRCESFIDINYVILPNGSLKIGSSLFNVTEYCGEITWDSSGYINLVNFMMCGQEADKAYTTITYGVLFIIGGCCLFLTVAITILLPEMRRNTHHYLALTHNSALMVAYFFWGFGQLGNAITIIQCCITSLIIQFSFLGSLFWLNAMCIEMSAAFRKLRVRNRSERSELRRYFVYSLYAWGLTTIITTITAIMEYIETRPFGLPKPGMSCFCGFARETMSIFVYFYGPMAILLIFNLLLYIFTTWKIISLQKATKILHQKGSNSTGSVISQSDMKKLVMYTKLFLLMGLTWFTEIISWAVGSTNIFSFILEIVNLLRAVFICYVFLCKKKVLVGLRERVRGFHQTKIFYSEESSRRCTEMKNLND